MIKTLARFLAGATMVCGVGLFGITASAQAQVSFILSADTNSGPAGTYPQTIHVYNAGTNATGVTVTFTPPKGVKVDSACLVDHLPGGLRSYTCLVGSITGGQTVDIAIVISMNKPGDASFYVDVACDQGVTAGMELSIILT
jgi:hypothetical protein